MNDHRLGISGRIAGFFQRAQILENRDRADAHHRAQIPHRDAAIIFQALKDRAAALFKKQQVAHRRPPSPKV